LGKRRKPAPQLVKDDCHVLCQRRFTDSKHFLSATRKLASAELHVVTVLVQNEPMSMSVSAAVVDPPNTEGV
jgi:hypothetical protein